MIIYMIIYMISKWSLNENWNENSSFFKIRHHRFFFLISIITSLSIIFTINVKCHFRKNLMTCKEIFSSAWKNPKTIFWLKTSKTWWKWWIEIENLIKMKSARSLFLDKSISYDYRWMSFLYEPDNMQEKFFICMKRFENDFSSDDSNDWFSLSSRSRSSHHFL
jgi:hypothetical protein